MGPAGTIPCSGWFSLPWLPYPARCYVRLPIRDSPPVPRGLKFALRRGRDLRVVWLTCALLTAPRRGTRPRGWPWGRGRDTGANAYRQPEALSICFGANMPMRCDRKVNSVNNALHVPHYAHYKFSR